MSEPLSSTPSLRKALGPGILVAGAAIGGSHILSSTQAGADFGWALLPMLILANLFKYPFFLYGQRYTAATGETLLHGYLRLGRGYLNTYLVFTLLNAGWSIGGVALITGFLLTYIPVLQGVNPVFLMVLVTLVCVAIALGGRYRALDITAKTIISLLAISTVLAVVLAVGQGGSGTPEEPISPYTLLAFGWVIVFMGWMPAPLDLTVWASLWMGARQRQTGHRISMREAMFDFHLGYLASVILAFFFLALGALVLWGSPQDVPFRDMAGVRFATTFIGLYAESIGEWSRYLVWLAAVTCMFSTTLTCIDGWPRAVSFTINLQTKKGRDEPDPRGHPWVHSLTTVFVVVTAIALVYLFFRYQILDRYLATAMVIAFVTTPYFAFLNFRVMNLPHVPENYRPKAFLKTLSYLGLAFFTIFTLLFIVWLFL